MENFILVIGICEREHRGDRKIFEKYFQNLAKTINS